MRTKLITLKLITLKLITLKLITLLLLFMPAVLQAKINIDHKIQGRVADRITGEAIPAKVFLLRADSTVIDTMTAVIEESQMPFQDSEAWYVFSNKIHKAGRYIIKAVMPNYKDACVDVQFKSLRQPYITAKPILMEREYHELKEVVVKATKIKMVMRGDTIVYNADAFNLAEGSMLDALISRLPGAQLTKEGQIFVNGKLVQSLLLNGRDFFAGNPKLALENLPAYTVGKIKVYNRAGSASRLMQTDMGDRSLVMDVNLKKKYDATIFGNVEAGAGSKNRFALKGFGMKVSQKEIFMAFANVNNLNDNQVADMQGEWSPQKEINGLQTNRTANISYAKFFGGDMLKWISTNNTISHDDDDIQTIKNAEVYLPTGNHIEFLQGKTNAKTTTFDSKNGFNYVVEGKYASNTSFNFLYSRNKKYGNDFTTNSDAAQLLNELIEKNTHDCKQYNFKLTNEENFNVNTVDMLHLGAGLEFKKQNAKSFSLYDLQYSDATDNRDFRDNYLTLDSRYWDIKGDIKYHWIWPGWSISPGYDYNYKYNKTNNSLFRLDKLADYDSLSYDILPSTKNALLTVIDKNNSYWYTEYQNHHRIMLEWNINAASGANKFNIEYGYVRLPLRIVNKNLFYTRLGRHDVSRNSVFFEPELYFRGGQSFKWEFSASVKSEIPDLTAMVEYTDDSDPLFLISGNPDLKNIHRYNTSLSVSREGEGQRLWHASLAYNKTDNDIAYATLYDTRTGIATMKPVSVNGNWRLNGLFDYTFPLDSARRWTLDNHLSVKFDHNIDMTTTAADAESSRSEVNNWQYGADIKLNYRPNDKSEYALHGSGSYYYINSSRSGFENIHAGDYRIGVETEQQLPWKLSFGTDFGLYARRGYQNTMMNSTEWIWNAHLSRSFFKGALLAKVTCYDLLHQRSTTKYEMNSQGRTEIWYNSLPSYVMFSATWKFNVIPKK